MPSSHLFKKFLAAAQGIYATTPAEGAMLHYILGWVRSFESPKYEKPTEEDLTLSSEVLEGMMNLAIEAEKSERYMDAVVIYEGILSLMSKPPLDVFLNLLFLYFMAHDYGFQCSAGFNLAFVCKAEKCIKKYIAWARRVYPGCVEIDFWENYIYYRYWGQEPFHEFDTKFFEQDESLVPYFFICYLANEEVERQYDDKVRLLIEQVKEGRTYKERYVKWWAKIQIYGNTRRV